MAVFRHTEAKEMMQIQGCYVYMINDSGQVGAFLGFKTFSVVVPLCRGDVDPLHAFVRVYRWLYPLARSFSPIYIWGPDKLVFPEPFSKLNKPNYIVVRLPYEISEYQKSTLWNLLDMFAHVRGKFQKITPEERKALERHYFLTEIFPFNEQELTIEPPNKNAPDLKVLQPLTHPALSYKGKPYVEKPIFLSVALDEKYKCCLPKGKRAKVTPQKCCYLPGKCDNRKKSIVSLSNVRDVSEKYSSRRMKEETMAGGISHDWVSLPDNSGNVLRQYLIGPRDPQHIKITVIPMTIQISEVLHLALRTVFKEQVRLRAEKELKGIPPSFEQRKQRLFRGFGKAPRLNEFGPDLLTPKPTIVVTNNVPEVIGLSSPIKEALKYQYLEGAAVIFDKALRTTKMYLLSSEPDESEVDKMDKNSLTGGLIPRPLYIRYQSGNSIFGTLMTLTQNIENEIIYKPTTNYFERLNEDCEHHHPKLRPRNPYLDPMFTYSRYAPKYHVPT